MRITVTRIICQSFFVGLAVFLAAVTQFGYLRGYPVSLFLQLDPLVALATAATTHRVYRGLIWALAIIAPGLLLGRFFCGWICPFGALQQFVAWLGGGGRRTAERIRRNLPRPQFATKYYLLAGMAGAALVGSLQVGLLDPLCTLFRSFTLAVLPLADSASGHLHVRPHVQQSAWLVGALLFFVLSLSLAFPRHFCRAWCPLGALLGLLARFSLWRIHRDPDACVHCDLCVANCQGAADPHARLRKAECFLCMECVQRCPHGALSLRFLPEPDGEVTYPQADGRRAALAALAGLLLAGWTRRSAHVDDPRPALIRPPGALAESAFLERCIKCEQCVRVCPTNVLQPALSEAGLEGLWTPVLKMRVGYCELNCTLCGQVCPTGAIAPLSVAQKLGTGPYAEQGPVRTGTAFYDRGRCLPWAMDTPCVVCEEVCPTSPKAIYTRREQTVNRRGEPVWLQRPYVDPDRCIGCGICQHECPVKDRAAIRVTAIGETRSPGSGLLLR